LQDKELKAVLPTGAEERNALPIMDAVVWYFPNAIAEVAKVSVAGNKQHNLGPIHWDRSKSTDHANKILKHLIDAGTFDTDGTRHSAKVAWRALAQLEDELIAAGAIPGRNAINAPASQAIPKSEWLEGMEKYMGKLEDSRKMCAK
jgi:hypothetical protein